MLKVLFGMVAGALIAVLVIGYVTGPPELPGKEWFKKYWQKPGMEKVQKKSAAVWLSQPRVANGHVDVTAWGAADMDDSKNRAHAVALALRTARHLAFEQLAEYLRGARSTGRSQYQGDVLERADLKMASTAVIRGAKVVKEDVQELSDGSIRAVVTVRHPLPKGSRV